MTCNRLVATLCALPALIAFAAPVVAAEEHPRLHAALYEMREARTELKEAKHDFGGHREKALDALDVAITQIDKALKAVDDNIKSGPPAKEVYKGYSNHPHIHHALHEAKEARQALKDASHNYKGHKEKAIEALDVVIDQLEKALKYAK